MVDTITARPAVADFANLMEEKLSAVEERHPEGWGKDTPLALFTRAEDRMDRLYVGLETAATNEEVGQMAVDVANWMMMIADNVGFLSDMYGK